MGNGSLTQGNVARQCNSNNCNTCKITAYLFQILTETISRMSSVKKAFLEIWQNSQENTCARVSFLIKRASLLKKSASLLKRRLWYSFYFVNFAKFLRPPFFLSTSSGCFCIKLFLINAPISYPPLEIPKNDKMQR